MYFLKNYAILILAKFRAQWFAVPNHPMLEMSP